MNKPVLFLATESVQRNILQQQWIEELNNQLKVDKDIYQTPIISLNTNDGLEKNKDDSTFKIGLYDPFLLLAQHRSVTTEHLFTNIETVKNGMFKKDFDAVIGRHHDVIVTMETWSTGQTEKDRDVLTNIVTGVYDHAWVTLYQIISNVPQTVYLRWGHEMEVPVDRYPWQMQDPVAYIKAFRYVASFQEPKANNIKIVWGPAGDRGSVEWWPGDNVVDYTSIAVFALPDKNINDYSKQQSFTSIFQSKFHRIRFANKPIFITEFGVKGPEAYQKKWLKEAASTINKRPEIKGISYFNSADSPKAWGDAKIPDWSITKDTFKSFVGFLKNLPGN